MISAQAVSQHWLTSDSAGPSPTSLTTISPLRLSPRMAPIPIPLPFSNTQPTLRTISKAWLDCYFQASKVLAHFSQLLCDPSSKPSFSSLLVIQPHRSHQSALRATLQTFPTFSQPSTASSPFVQVSHRDDNSEDAPPPKRIHTDHSPTFH